MIFKGDNVVMLTFSRLEFSKAQESRKRSNLPERPHSRSGPIETSADHGTTNERSGRFPKARGPEVANPSSLFDPTPNPGLKTLRSQSCPDLRSIKQAHLPAINELGRKSVGENHAVGGRTEVAPEDYEKGPDAGATTNLANDKSAEHASEPESSLATEQNVHVVEHDETSKNEPRAKPQENLPDPPVKAGMELGVSLQMSLPIRTRTLILSRKPLQTAPRFARAEKRPMEREDEELEALVCRKTKRRITITRISALSAIIVETAKTLQSNLSFKPIPSRFHESS